MQLKKTYLAALLFSFSSLLPTAVAIDCYSHNGVNANSSEFYNATRDGALIACGTGATTCCMENEYCDVDLLCHSRSTGGYSRQYCTDPDWPEGACSQLCPSYGAAGIALTSCDDSGTKFCCGPGAQDCCKAGNYTEINKKNGQIVAIGTSTVPTTTTSATPTSSSNATTSGSSAASATTTAAGANADADSGNGLTEQSKLGIGLGIGLGVPFLIAAGVALFFWRRSLAAKADAGAEKNTVLAGAAGAGAADPNAGAPYEVAGSAAPPYGYGYTEQGQWQAQAQASGHDVTGNRSKSVHQLEANEARAELEDVRVHEMP